MSKSKNLIQTLEYTPKADISKLWPGEFPSYAAPKYKDIEREIIFGLAELNIPQDTEIKKPRRFTVRFGSTFQNLNIEVKIGDSLGQRISLYQFPWKSKPTVKEVANKYNEIIKAAVTFFGIAQQEK